MNFRKFRKSAKALSPVIATIILIAVTVAVSVVVAAWMGALTIGFMGNSEQAKVTNVVLTNTYDTVRPTSTRLAQFRSYRYHSKHRFRNSNHIFSNYRWKYCNNSWRMSLVARTTKILHRIQRYQLVKRHFSRRYLTVTYLQPTTAFINSAQYTITLMTAKGNTITSFSFIQRILSYIV